MSASETRDTAQIAILTIAARLRLAQRDQDPGWPTPGKLPPRFTQRDQVDANSARQLTAAGQAATLEFDEGPGSRARHHPMFVHEFGETSLVMRDESSRVAVYLFGFIAPTRVGAMLLCLSSFRYNGGATSEQAAPSGRGYQRLHRADGRALRPCRGRWADDDTAEPDNLHLGLGGTDGDRGGLMAQCAAQGDEGGGAEDRGDP